MTKTQSLHLLIGGAGLDQVFHGDLISQRACLIRGGLGSGKTMLDTHFLTSIDSSSNNLLVILGKDEVQLRGSSRRSCPSLNGENVLCVSPDQASDVGSDTYKLLRGWYVKANNPHGRILDHVRGHRPKRVLMGLLNQMRYLYVDAFQFRKQVLSLLRALMNEWTTVLFTSEESTNDAVSLKPTKYGRLCNITKFRGADFEYGAHFYQLDQAGIILFSHFMPSKFFRFHTHIQISSGLPELDAILNGRIKHDTMTSVSGPTGVGKTTLGAQLIIQTAANGEPALIYNFGENASTFFIRYQQACLAAEDIVDKDYLHFKAIEPLLCRFTQLATSAQKEAGTANTPMMIDSLSKHHQSMSGENLQERVHALCRHLIKMSVTGVQVNEVFTITSTPAQVPEYGLSYVADNIIMFSHIEFSSEFRKTMGVLKTRASSLEKALRKFDITKDGFKVDQTLGEMRGLMRAISEIVQPNHFSDHP